MFRMISNWVSYFYRSGKSFGIDLRRPKLKHGGNYQLRFDRHFSQLSTSAEPFFFTPQNSNHRLGASVNEEPALNTGRNNWKLIFPFCTWEAFNLPSTFLLLFWSSFQCSTALAKSGLPRAHIAEIATIALRVKAPVQIVPLCVEGAIHIPRLGHAPR